MCTRNQQEPCPRIASHHPDAIMNRRRRRVQRHNLSSTVLLVRLVWVLVVFTGAYYRNEIIHMMQYLFDGTTSLGYNNSYHDWLPGDRDRNAYHERKLSDEEEYMDRYLQLANDDDRHNNGPDGQDATNGPTVFGYTKMPSTRPTRVPSSSPSARPSKHPSTSPSRMPSRSPTGKPSMEPTVSPSQPPSLRPSSSPSALPSASPESSPSSSPTGKPTYFPSFLPSSLPSYHPTQRPTFLPSGWPSGSPEESPSQSPTGKPTNVPSVEPSRIPSRLPSGSPEESPSQSPSGKPTMTPSVEPSRIPSRLPSSSPEESPSQSPSGNPTHVPTMKPSVGPSALPTTAPSKVPTMRPSLLPSQMPSGKPTFLPTVEPSLVPSMLPSDSPEASPSQNPSSMPTANPSTWPTALPSFLPSVHPTGIPSLLPSTHPSALPSHTPSEHPTWTPSSDPSLRPSNIPTAFPSVTPTLTPSVSPSSIPTGRPTSIPTGHPTGIPSAQPSRNPTRQPSLLPSSSPSLDPCKGYDGSFGNTGANEVVFSFMYGIESDRNVMKSMPATLSDQIKEVEQALLDLLIKEYFPDCDLNSNNGLRRLDTLTKDTKLIDDESIARFVALDDTLIGLKSSPIDLANGRKCVGDFANNIDYDADCNVIDGKMTVYVSDMVHANNVTSNMISAIKAIMDDKLLDDCHLAVLRVMFIELDGSRFISDDNFEIETISSRGRGGLWMIALGGVGVLLITIVGTRYRYSSQFKDDGSGELKDKHSNQGDASEEFVEVGSSIKPTVGRYYR